jgi:cytochrome c oxidase subunit III
LASGSLALREQFGTPQQQRDTSTVGMWIFLATEVLFFGALFVGYGVYRMYYTPGFVEGSREMTLTIGAINTAVLFTSCLTMSLAVRSISEGQQFRAYILLLTTAGIGLLFIALKFLEYYIHYQERKVPGIWFESSSPFAHAEELFLVYYFVMTGLHVVHLTIGVILTLIMAARTAIGRFTPAWYTPVEMTSIFWHFVDIIWCFLFVIFYIPGFHK